MPQRLVTHDYFDYASGPILHGSEETFRVRFRQDDRSPLADELAEVRLKGQPSLSLGQQRHFCTGLRSGFVGILPGYVTPRNMVTYKSTRQSEDEDHSSNSQDAEVMGLILMLNAILVGIQVVPRTQKLFSFAAPGGKSEVPLCAWPCKTWPN